MARTDHERKVRLRPPKPRRSRDERIAWSSGFKLLMHSLAAREKSATAAPPAEKGEARVHTYSVALSG
jgi:hypothetical protein